jgi:hypothetical protein
MVGIVHCEIFGPFKAYIYIIIDVSYAAKKNLQIFLNEEFLLQGEERESIFSGKYLQKRIFPNISQN